MFNVIKALLHFYDLTSDLRRDQGSGELLQLPTEADRLIKKVLKGNLGDVCLLW